MLRHTVFALAVASFAWTPPGDLAQAAAIDLPALELIPDPTLFSYDDAAVFLYLDGVGLTILSASSLFGASGFSGAFDAAYEDNSIAFSGTGAAIGTDAELIEVLFQVDGASPFSAPYFLMSLSGPELGADPSPLLELTGPDGALGFAGLSLTAVRGIGEVPLPAGLPLLLSAVGALWLVRRPFVRRMAR
jgi:hypothetical protein